jgi:hypothetical protein
MRYGIKLEGDVIVPVSDRYEDAVERARERVRASRGEALVIVVAIEELTRVERGPIVVTTIGAR